MPPQPSPDPSDELSPDLLQAIVEEACRKSSVLWLTYDGGGRPRPAWHIWADGAAVVLVAHAPDSAEQRLPGLTDAARATVTCRAKDGRARLISWKARVDVVAPGTSAWEEAYAALRTERLNTTDLPTVGERWAATAAIVRLIPTGEVTEYPGAMPDESGAATPPETPATTRGRLPRVLGRRARRSRRLS